MTTVALESTVFSRLGLPAPANAEALARATAAIEERGAVAAVAAVLDGVARIAPLDGADHERVLVGEVLVERSDRDAGGFGDVVRGRGVVAALAEKASRLGEDACDEASRPLLAWHLARFSVTAGMRVERHE